MLEEMGKRLFELRKALSRDSNEEWTQSKVSEEVGLSINAIHRLERGSGSIENFLILLNFYHRKGYNTQWAIADDNSDIGMYRNEKASDQEVRKALENLNKVINNKFS
jgi:transcriptional regulator with XRE-family HTH domain